MDCRIEKTKRSIYNAFIKLRADKSLEKLTVKELCEEAQINKSTFYVYYNDVYDLSDKVEDEIVSEVVKNFDSDVIDTVKFSKYLFNAYGAQGTLISTVFSGTRAQLLPKKIETVLKETIFTRYPQYKNDFDFNIRLTFTIYGGFYAYKEYAESDREKLIDTIGELSNKVVY
ncbi:MAG: TetR/AcrR family transcriptional regulator [Oscillospiraceae bacterium]|nr:TetR/AcrR family transcriptional regulator [Oscillospiraceae bacterium]